MINVSNEFKTVVSGSDRKFYPSAVITLADNTVLNIDNSRIKQLKIEDATSQSGSFSIGSAIINKLTLSINNVDDAYSEYDFTNAVIRPSVGLQLSASIETLNKGVFTADDPKVKSSTITLTALDNMVKFDKPFSGVSQIFPCTAQSLLNTVCTYCGVSLGTSTFDNDDFSIQEIPSDEATSCREIISWIAQLGGNFARINTSGALEIKWYDMDVFEDETYDDLTAVDGLHSITSTTSLSLSTDDVVITGITVCDSSEDANSYTSGTSGYLIQIDNNDLVRSLADATSVATFIGNKIIGMRFRPLSATAKSDPSVEAGDIAKVLDRKGNYYHAFLSNVSYGVYQSMKLSCDAESPARNSATRYSTDTKTIVKARQTAEKKIDAYDLAVQQFFNLMTYGFGLYKSEEVLPDGSTIYYMHDKPTVAESSAVWKFNSNGIFLSNDHGVTWGVDTNGNMLVNVLTAIGINAEWIKVLTSFTVGTKFSVDAEGKLTASDADISGKVKAESGEISGFSIVSEDATTHDGGLLYYNPTLGKYIRISPFSVGDGSGNYDTNYGGISLGLSEDGLNSLLFLRSDGYARFGLVSENGVSIRFNDFLRYDQNVTGATDTIFYTPNFKIKRDGTIEGAGGSSISSGTGTITTTGWVTNTGDYGYKLDLAISGILATDYVDIFIDNDDLDTAQTASISPNNSSYDGGVTLYAKSVPTSAMNFTYRRMR